MSLRSVRRGALLAALGLAAPAAAQPAPSNEPAPEAQAPVIVEVESGPPLEPAPALEGPAPVEVTVEGHSDARALRRSSRAVTVIDTEQARRESSDLGDVVNRAAGVTVQRAGGLGSAARLSLNGLTAEQVRVFLDGVPLELAGYPLGLATVPVDFVHRVDIYRGVVPTRLGADALGGAIDLVSEEDLHGSRTAAAYQTGSFGTHRVSALTRHRDDDSGAFVRLRAFLDHADNDYFVDVTDVNDRGNPEPIRARRFHDAYTAYGFEGEAGLVDHADLDELLLRVFHTRADRDVQSSRGMAVPFGEVVFARATTGVQLRHRQRLPGLWRVQSIAGLTFTSTPFVDVSDCRYDWRGRCDVERAFRGEAPEGFPHDQDVQETSPYLRTTVEGLLAPGHLLRFSVAPTYATRSGEDRAVAPGFWDPLSARRRAFTGVAGVEYEATLLDGLLENTLFAKGYLQTVSAREELESGVLSDVKRRRGQPGVGDSLRLTLHDGVYAKASYEYATRMPSSNELFGNGVEVLANFHLEPEVSHNANLGLTAERVPVGFGALRADVNGFVRDVDDQIILLGNGSWFVYDNVQSTRSLGVESSLGWSSPRDLFEVDGAFTFQDLRNTSSAGPFRDHEGERLPNRPYLFADLSARLSWPRPFTAHDSLSLGYRMHWVDAFLFEWARFTTDQSIAIPTQLTHALVATYAARWGRHTLSASVEAQNLSDAQVYDLYGVQRPGRAFYGKLALSL